MALRECVLDISGNRYALEPTCYETTCMNDSLAQRYDRLRPIYTELVSVMMALLGELITVSGIPIILIEGRVKDLSHVIEKSKRPGHSYFDPLDEMTDLAGVRVVAPTLIDVDRVSAILRREFEIDYGNSVDKAAGLGPDQFGYQSKHYVLRLREPRSTDPGLLEMASLWVEVQLRTALQDAWAKATYHRLYKSEEEIPPSYRRRFHALAAMFELADREFSLLSDATIATTAEPIASNDDEPTVDQQLDAMTIVHYVGSEPVKEWITIVEGLTLAGFDAPYAMDRIHLMEHLEEARRPREPARVAAMARSVGLTNTKALDRLLTGSRGWGEDFFLQYLASEKRSRSKSAILAFQFATTVMHSDDIVAMLIIANYPSLLDERTLRVAWGFQPAEARAVLTAARRTNPHYEL